MVLGRLARCLTLLLLCMGVAAFRSACFSWRCCSSPCSDRQGRSCACSPPCGQRESACCVTAQALVRNDVVDFIRDEQFFHWKDFFNSQRGVAVPAAAAAEAQPTS